jgi:hypothetical protein
MEQNREKNFFFLFSFTTDGGGCGVGRGAAAGGLHVAGAVHPNFSPPPKKAGAALKPCGTWT